MLPELEDISKLSPAALLLLALNIVGFVLSKSALKNNFIPFVLPLLGAVIYPLLAGKGIAIVVQGFCIGGLAIWANQAFRNAIEYIYEKRTDTTKPNPPPGV